MRGHNISDKVFRFFIKNETLLYLFDYQNFTRYFHNEYLLEELKLIQMIQRGRK